MSRNNTHPTGAGRRDCETSISPDPDALVAAFCAAGGSDADPDELGPVLAGALATARDACPGTAVDAQRFVAHLARALPADRPVAAALARTCVADVLVAVGCAAGDRGALDRFGRCVLDATATLRRRGLSRAECDEVAQRLRVKLLTSAAGAPRILEYTGAGELMSWLRVSALREAHNLRRETHREDLIGESSAIEAFACTGQTPDSIQVAHESREVFVAAFRAGFAMLSARERNLMRLHYVDRVEMQDLARAYRVHRVTVGRWLDSARDRLCTEVESRLASRLQAGASEVDKLIQFVRGGRDLSLGRLLATVTGAS